MPWFGGARGSCCPGADGKPKGKKVAPIKPQKNGKRGGKKGGKKGGKERRAEAGCPAEPSPRGRRRWFGEGNEPEGAGGERGAERGAERRRARGPGAAAGYGAGRATLNPGAYGKHRHRAPSSRRGSARRACAPCSGTVVKHRAQAPWRCAASVPERCAASTRGGRAPYLRSVPKHPRPSAASMHHVPEHPLRAHAPCSSAASVRCPRAPCPSTVAVHHL